MKYTNKLLLGALSILSVATGIHAWNEELRPGYEDTRGVYAIAENRLRRLRGNPKPAERFSVDFSALRATINAAENRLRDACSNAGVDFQDARIACQENFENLLSLEYANALNLAADVLELNQ